VKKDTGHGDQRSPPDGGPTAILLRELVSHKSAPVARASAARQDFRLESLSPFEMTRSTSADTHTVFSRVNEMLEVETRRIARALHDESGQLLTVVHIALEELAAELPSSLEPRLQKVRAGLERMEQQLRRLSHELSAPMLDEFGLLPALRFLAEGVSKRTGVAAKVDGNISRRLDPRVELALYRSVQEALTNVMKHARASQVQIQVKQQGKAAICCSVRDDGVGFNLPLVVTGGFDRGIGLAGMRERLKVLGGDLQIKSAFNQGTALLIRIPLGDQCGYRGALGGRPPARARGL
jgi:two-component system, NarL family, sensor histidine kinase NreB